MTKLDIGINTVSIYKQLLKILDIELNNITKEEDLHKRQWLIYVKDQFRLIDTN